MNPNIPKNLHASSAVAVSRMQRLRQSTAGYWLAAFVMVLLPFIAANALSKLLLSDPSLLNMRNLLKLLVLLAGFAAYVHWWERRDVYELSRRFALLEISAGLLLGGVLFASVMGLLALFGVFTVEHVGTLGDFATAIMAMLPKMLAGAVIEEVLFRLLLLRLLERSLGTAWALAISSLLFGLAHVGNVGATPFVSILLGFELGLLFGAAYLLTRRLWLCASLHLGWNFTQGAIFSVAVSGHTGDGWLRGTLTGPTWLTGGAFGVEGSVVAVFACVLVSIMLLVIAYKRRWPHSPRQSGRNPT